MAKNFGMILAVMGISLAAGLSGWTQEKPPAKVDKETLVQGEIPFEKALALVEKNEKKFKARVRTLEWTWTQIKFKHSKPGNEMVPVPADPNLNEVDTIFFEPSSGKYRVVRDGTVAWIDGADPYFTGLQISVFDGETEKEFERLRPGKVPPHDEAPGRGVIKEIKDQTVSENKFLPIFLAHIPPNFHMGDFSDVLKMKNKAKEIYSIKNDNGIMVVKMSVNHQDSKKFEDQVVYYNLSKGVIVKAERHGKPDIGGPAAGKAYQWFAWEYKELEKGLFLPTSVIEYNSLDNLGSQYSFSNILVNKTYKESPFQFEFPEGTIFPQK